MEGHALVSLTAKRASQKRNESLGGGGGGRVHEAHSISHLIILKCLKLVAVLQQHRLRPNLIFTSSVTFLSW